MLGQDVGKLAMEARNNLYDHWDFDQAEYYFKRVIGKRYAPAFVYSDYGWYLMLVDRHEEGMRYIQKAAEKDRKDVQLATWNAWALLWDGDVIGATKWIDKAYAINPDYGEGLYVGSLIASQTGNHEEAIRLAERGASMDVNWRAGVPLALAKAGQKEKAMQSAERIAEKLNAFDAMILIEVYALLGDDDKALYFLEKSYELRHPFMPWLKSVPNTQHLQQHPRFKAVVKKMNLPQ